MFPGYPPFADSSQEPVQSELRSFVIGSNWALRRGALSVCQAPCNASSRIEMAWATAARVAWVLLSGLSIMKSCVMPS